MEFRVRPRFHYESEIKIEAKILFCLEANRMHYLVCNVAKQQKSEAKTNRKKAK
jgi:hypothetical protein